MRGVVVWRPHRQGPHSPHPPPGLGASQAPLEALFSPEVALSAHAIVETYEARWAIAIDIH
jgi:hypothetical protein